MGKEGTISDVAVSQRLYFSVEEKLNPSPVTKIRYGREISVTPSYIKQWPVGESRAKTRGGEARRSVGSRRPIFETAWI